jgi:hypothetical protein
MIKSLIATSAALLVSGNICHAQSRAISDMERSLITSSYGQLLKDAGSAQYRMQPIPLSDNQKGGMFVYCFEVNAKNSYGGYAGYKTIIGMVTRLNGKITSFRYDGNSDDDVRSYPGSTADMCRAFGYSLS